MERVAGLSSENAVVIFTASSCAMCHTVVGLFYDLGVGAAVHELDKDPRGRDMERDLARRLGDGPTDRVVPAVFIGGELVGSTQAVMSLHLRGELVTKLRAAGAMEHDGADSQDATWVRSAL